MIPALVALFLGVAVAPSPLREEAPQTSSAQTSQSAVVADIRVHGNHLTSDAEIVSLSGLAIGMPFAPTTVADATRRLRAARRFEDVEVVQRFASIADASQILIILIVNEGPVRVEVPDDPTAPLRVVPRRGLRNLMFMPILDAEDGYGVTYGARLAHVGGLGKRSRISVPLTWGGLKRAGVEVDRTFTRGPFTRVELGAAVQRQRNPAFDEQDDRQRVWARADRAIGPLRAGVQAGWQAVSFGALDDQFRHAGADLTLDTRLDPLLPRNAVYAQAAWERIRFPAGGHVDRRRWDGRGYVGLIGQTTLVARAQRLDSSAPLPAYLKPLLGGWSNLRGFEAGTAAGDTLVAGSVELRVPLNSPLSFAKLGVSVFTDAGKVYDHGQRFADHPWRHGIGGSVWMTAAAFRLSLSVAHGRGATTRVNFGGGLSF